jgi:hypothetical protein
MDTVAVLTVHWHLVAFSAFLAALLFFSVAPTPRTLRCFVSWECLARFCASYAAVCEQHDFDKHWRMLWFFDAFWHSLYFVLMCVCALLWAPSANSKMYAPTLGTHSNSRTRWHSWSERWPRAAGARSTWVALALYEERV